MTKTPSFFLGIAACGLVASTLLAAAPVTRITTQQPSAANDPATGLFTRMCNECHDASRITAMRRSRTEWEEVLNKMVEKGAIGTEQEFETVYEYLLRNYGKVYINRAVADEITMILGLSKKDADAIIAYRGANGAFADFDAIKKVPDVDAKKLDEHKDAIAF
jgi:competence ComEA-like helix-hairpin-helix protein